MLAAERHEQAIRMYHQKEFEEASRLLTEALAAEETCELWNDWASAQIAVRRLADAERGFRRALELDPNDTQAAANLGALLVSMGKQAEAIPLLEGVKSRLTDSEQLAIQQLLAQCRDSQPVIRRRPLSASEVRKKIEGTRWYHSFEIMRGVVTPGLFPIKPAFYLDSFGIPADLRGKKAIDIGSYDGPIAFELERRGAEVTAFDIQDPSRTGFNTAKEILGSRVNYIHAKNGVYDVAGLVNCQFDIVMFLGVFYHLKNPIGAFEKIAQVMHRDSRLYFEGETLYRHAEDSAGKPVNNPLLQEMSDSDLPITMCYPGWYMGSPNWFIPNIACLKGWLKAAGFEVLRICPNNSGPTVKPPSQRTTGVARKVADSPIIEHGAR